MISIDFENINEDIVYEVFGVDGNETEVYTRYGKDFKQIGVRRYQHYILLTIIQKLG